MLKSNPELLQIFLRA